MSSDYVADLVSVRDALRRAINSGGLVQMRIGDQAYTVSKDWLQMRERELANKIRMRSGGGRSIIGEATL